MNSKLAMFCLGSILVAATTFAVVPTTIFEEDFSGYAAVDSPLGLPRGGVSNAYINAGVWYQPNQDNNTVFSFIVASGTVLNNRTIPATNSVSGTGSMRVGAINYGGGGFIVVTNVVWERQSNYSMTVVHRIGDRSGAVGDTAARGALSMQLGWVKANLNEVGFQTSVLNTNIDTSAWTTSVVEIAGADLAGGKGLPLYIRMWHGNFQSQINNSPEHFTWVDYIKLEKVNAFDVWAEGFGLAGVDAATTNNYDGDILNNLEEYAFGGDPSDPSDVGMIDSISANVVNLGGTNYLEFIYPRRSDYFFVDLDYSVHLSDDLVSDPFSYEGFFQVGVGVGEFGSFDAVTNHIPTVTNDVRFAKPHVQFLD